MKIFRLSVVGACFLVGLLLLVSCSQEDSLSVGSGDPVEILLSPSVSLSTSVSRSPFEDAPLVGTLQAFVFKSLASGNYVSSGVYSESLSLSGSGGTGFTVPQYFPVDDSPAYLCGLYPVDDLWENEIYSEATHSTTVAHALDGKTDLLIAPQVSMTKSVFLQSKVVTLQFRHVLTKLKVRLVADAASEFSVADIWGNVTGVELVSVGGVPAATFAQVNLLDGSASFHTPASGSYPIYCMSGDDLYPETDVLFANQDFAIPAEGVDVGYSLIAPFVPTGTDDFELMVYTTLFPQGVPVKVALAPISADESFSDTSGQYCVVTLSFNSGNKPVIQSKASITDWLPGANMDSVLD